MYVQKREIMYWERKVNLRGCESSTKENMQDFLKSPAFCFQGEIVHDSQKQVSSICQRSLPPK